jgi:succinoglycan biosynthesis transport protein ExoP
MEAVQQQSVPMSEARLISPALRPFVEECAEIIDHFARDPSGRRLLSFGVAYLREAWDGTLRTTGQVKDTLHFNCLAMAPVLAAPTARIDSNSDESKAMTADRKNAAPTQDWLRYAVDSPFSRYAEAIRSIKIAADLSGALKSHKVIGVTATLPNEGKYIGFDALL